MPRSEDGNHAFEQPRDQLPSTGGYDVPESYLNLDETGALPVDVPSNASEPNRNRHSLGRQQTESLSSAIRAAPRDYPDGNDITYTAPDDWVNLDELAATAPVENTRQDALYRHVSLDETRSRERELQQYRKRRRSSSGHDNQPVLPSEPLPGAEDETGKERPSVKVSRLATQIYTVSYLILFAILGTLARLGLVALTRYPGTPVIFNTVWANFAGSLVMGFLAEDRMLFLHEWGTPKYHQEIERVKQKLRNEENGVESNRQLVDLTAAKKAHMAIKKTIPLYIGLATGFCGSFTTFSSFIKDSFLALSNEMVTPGVADSPVGRNGGYSFMALLAVLITTVSLSLSGLFIGAHIALALEGYTPSIPFTTTRKFIDPLAVVVGWGCWLGAVFMSIFPPDSSWRGQVTFSLVFAPLGCLLRFYLSLHLNGRYASFPLGTFVANMLGTGLLGMAWDIAHVPIGGVVGCQVLQGMEDGFCGCLTTISTWVAELNSLRRRSAWIYGMASLVFGLVLMIAIMGGLRWSNGYGSLECLT